ncbi:MAG: HEAT repeat domain-containing protein [bacterium]|nr:HEAT repeat domain-containing protein [bacterium]
MSQRSQANEIAELIRRLGSRNIARAKNAAARLTIIGATAVEPLIEALEGTNNRVRARAMPLLEMIGDSRSREPLTAMLLDRGHRMRQIAARCLGRFPTPHVAAALERVLRRESHEKVKAAAVHSLVEHYVSGEDRALPPVLSLLVDTEASPGMRLAACSLLPALPASERAGIVRRLSDDPDAAVRRSVARLTDQRRAAGVYDERRVRALLGKLRAEDYPAWNEAVRRLARCGDLAIGPLVHEMRRLSDDPEFCTRAGMALRLMGPRRLRALPDYLEEIEEPLPLQVVIEVIGIVGVKAMIYRLEEVIDRLGRKPDSETEGDGDYLVQRVRAKAHLELARIGSRVAIADLRSMLENAEGPLEAEVVAAIEMIGKREEIVLLLRRYAAQDAFMRVVIGSAVRGIMKREHIRRNDRELGALPTAERRALDAILTARAPVHARKRRSEA